VTIELARRIAFTIGALLIFRLGSHIPVTTMWTLSGPLPAGALARLSIFSLNLVPYLGAAVLIRLLSMVWGRLSSLERSGEVGRNRIARYTLVLTLVLAALQAFGIASAIAGIPGLVVDQDGLFLLEATASMVGGTFFLIWLSELITLHGVGNGLALMLSVSILASLPDDVAATIELVRRGAVSGNLVLFNTLFWVAVVALIVFVESARRNVPVEFAERKVGKIELAARGSVLPLKVNSTGLLIPATVVPWVLYLPLLALAAIFGGNTPWLEAAFRHLRYAQPAHLILGAILVFVLAFVYASYVIDPERSAEQLHKQNGVIPGVEPGEATADYLDGVASLTMVIGALYLTALSLIPEALVAYDVGLPTTLSLTPETLVAYGAALPYKFSGGAALIVVCTILDLKTQVCGISRTRPPGGEQQ
jgi:preprotein translocase subunit SecY